MMGTSQLSEFILVMGEGGALGLEMMKSRYCKYAV
jgi:hypothetical protein